MGKNIPERWCDYKPIGSRIDGTRFIAFKVPLRKNINASVNKETRLDPETLLESIPNIGLIIDLTSTTRYYQPEEITTRNVDHYKLMIPGQQVPNKFLANKFCAIVWDFLKNNDSNDKLIGVHCTHGVNRTGYLLSYFLITQLQLSPEEAINKVATARGHKIERENYTQALYNLSLPQNLRRQHLNNEGQHNQMTILNRNQYNTNHNRRYSPYEMGRRNDYSQNNCRNNGNTSGNWRNDYQNDSYNNREQQYYSNQNGRFFNNNNSRIRSHTNQYEEHQTNGNRWRLNQCDVYQQQQQQEQQQRQLNVTSYKNWRSNSQEYWSRNNRR